MPLIQKYITKLLILTWSPDGRIASKVHAKTLWQALVRLVIESHRFGHNSRCLSLATCMDDRSGSCPAGGRRGQTEERGGRLPKRQWQTQRSPILLLNPEPKRPKKSRVIAISLAARRGPGGREETVPFVRLPVRSLVVCLDPLG